jgi:DNA-binding SARP family transcriptional activator
LAHKTGRLDGEVLSDETSVCDEVADAEAVLLVDAGTRIVWWSEALARRLHATGIVWRRGMSCCEALDCARNTGSPRGCLTRLALGRADGLEPRPWALERGGRRLHGRISARGLHASGGDVVVFELRVARAGTALVAAPVEVAALGRLSVMAGGVVRDGDWVQQRPGQVFRYLLAAREGPQRSEVIASVLWPGRGRSAVANVRYSIFKLRERLGEKEEPGPSLIVHAGGGYQIDPRRLRLDVDVFQRKVAEGIAAQRRDDVADAEATLGEALGLYRGDFLVDDPYADWAFTEREYLHSLAGKGLAALAQIALANGRLVAAADHLRRLAQLEPFDSRVHQMLIEVCLRRGRRTEALRHYHALGARLHRAFGEQPDFELANIAAALTERG